MHLPTRYAFVVVFALVLIVGALVYTRQVTRNPPGFFVDESSVAYNAFTISQTGRDEFGVAWPLYFRAFGDYKNPVYIYLLALIFRITGPSILVARMFSAALGIITALVLGLVGYRLTRHRWIALAVTVMAFGTPWLFMLSRTVVEVALYPLAVALFLLAVARVAEKNGWKWIDALWIGLTLALLTYTYSIGRLLAPLLAFGLIIFARRARILSVARAWLIYAASLAPLLIFRWRHPGALEARFTVLTYLTPQLAFSSILKTFVGHYLNNINPWRMVFTGDPEGYQIASTYGTGPVLFITFLLAVAGVWVVLSRKRFSPWWAFVVYGLFVSIVPASLTHEYFHILRLSPVPIFLIVLTLPALEWVSSKPKTAKRLLIAVALVLTCGQAIYFQVVHEHRGREAFRQNMFDADYPTSVLPAAMTASGPAPIYLADVPAVPEYIQAFWYGTIEHVALEKFVILPPDQSAPVGAVVISSEGFCARCRQLYHRDPLLVYVLQELPRSPQRLPDAAMRAEIRPINFPQTLKPGEAATIRVAVRNAGEVTWYAGERPSVPLQVRLGNHWLDQNRNALVNDDGRAALVRDLAPGQETEIDLIINAPINPGKYILEIDVLQEGVSWFGLRGSKTLQLPITIVGGGF